MALHVHSNDRKQTGDFRRPALLDLGFFVDDVLARDRIEFLHLNFIRGRALVLVRGIEMPGAGGRFEFDFFSHDPSP